MIWIKGQAAEMGISVTPRQISRELALLKKQAFKSEAEYHRFLKESHFTRRDVRERVEEQLLTKAIVGRVNRESATQKALEEFAEAYEKRWRARTVCAPEYMVPASCSNAAPATPE